MNQAGNIYLAVAKAQWHSGEDGEVIARALAKALLHVITQGTDKSPVLEFERLIKED